VSEPPPPFPSASISPSRSSSASSSRSPSMPTRPSQPPRPKAPGADTLWVDAYRTRMRGQHVAVLVLSLVGSVILWLMGRDHRAALVAIACMGLIVVVAWIQYAVSRKRGDESFYWPWAWIAALAIGPSYAFGLHSAFAAVIATLLFVGGSFRA